MGTTTDKIFTYAQNQAMPEHGEGWKLFTDILHAKMSEMERILRQVLPDDANGEQVCAKITEKDVVMIRDFLANVEWAEAPECLIIYLIIKLNRLQYTIERRSRLAAE